MFILLLTSEEPEKRNELRSRDFRNGGSIDRAPLEYDASHLFTGSNSQGTEKELGTYSLLVFTNPTNLFASCYTAGRSSPDQPICEENLIIIKGQFPERDGLTNVSKKNCLSKFYCIIESPQQYIESMASIRESCASNLLNFIRFANNEFYLLSNTF